MRCAKSRKVGVQVLGGELGFAENAFLRFGMRLSPYKLAHASGWPAATMLRCALCRFVALACALSLILRLLVVSAAVFVATIRSILAFVSVCRTTVRLCLGVVRVVRGDSRERRVGGSRCGEGGDGRKEKRRAGGKERKRDRKTDGDKGGTEWETEKENLMGGERERR